MNRGGAQTASRRSGADLTVYGDPSWRGYETPALMELAELTPGRFAALYDDFSGGASDTDFGANWTVTAGSGSCTHTPAAGVRRGGICSLYNPSGFFVSPSLRWKSGPVVTDVATERWAMSVRTLFTLGPPNSANIDARLGLENPAGGNHSYIGIHWPTSTTNLAIVCGGVATVLPVTLASLVGAGEITFRLIQKPVAGSRTLIAYMNGAEMGRATMGTTLVNRTPILSWSNGECILDDWLMLVGGGFDS